MNDQMPDFDPSPDLSTPAPKKERKKPQKRRKAVKKAVEIKGTDKRLRVNRKKRRVMKVGRRGRPPGALNKVKAERPVDTTLLSSAVYNVLAAVIQLSKEERAQVTLHMKGLFR
jgi:hypothetical protein